MNNFVFHLAGICQENPCGNRGLCIEKSLTSFECRCYYDYIGSTCQERVTNKNPHIWSCKLRNKFFDFHD